MKRHNRPMVAEAGATRKRMHHARVEQESILVAFPSQALHEAVWSRGWKGCQRGIFGFLKQL